MSEFDFSLIVAVPPMTFAQILDATDALGVAGCTDTLIRGHPSGMGGWPCQSMDAMAWRAVSGLIFVLNRKPCSWQRKETISPSDSIAKRRLGTLPLTVRRAIGGTLWHGQPPVRFHK